MEGLYIAHVNIRSLIPSFPDISDMLLHEGFHIFAITETWLSPDYPDAFIGIPGFQIYRTDRITRGGGVCLYVRSVFCCELVDTTGVFDEGTDNDIAIENMWVSVKYKKRRILVGVLYRPPLVHYRQLGCIETILSYFSSSFDYTIIMGDLNINFLNNNTEKKYLESLLHTFNLSQVIKEPSRVTRNTSSLIDVIGVENSINIRSGTKEMFNLTDHRLVFSYLKIESAKARDKTLSYRDFSHFNNEQFNLKMENFDYESVLRQDSLDESVTVFNRGLADIFDEHAPFKTVHIRRKYKPYITNTIQQIIKLKKNAFNKYKRTKEISHKNYYLDLKNYLSIAIRSEKRAYMGFELSQASRDPKKLWSNINEWNIHSKNNNEIPAHLRDVDLISANFAGVNRLAVPIDKDTLNFYKENKMEGLGNEQFQFANISEYDVLRAFARIKSKSMGIDCISHSMLLFSINHIAAFITTLFNRSLQTGGFPSVWKTSIVTPLPKSPKIESVSELRPICHLPILAKMLELLVSDMIKEYVSKKNILPQTQSGFRKGHSTATALSKVTSDISQNIDNNLISCLILLDYSKAFDLINHDMLIAKLQYFGFSEQSCVWILNYLELRAQVVELDDTRSESVILRYGVPQGSILGPLLFGLYTADLPGMAYFGHIQLYADDTQLLAGFPPERACQSLAELNGDLKRIFTWSHNHGLILNTKKSCYMKIGTSTTKNKFDLFNFVPLNIDGILLPCVEHARNLGVIFDETLDFEAHVNKKLAAVYIKLKSLYAFKYLLPENIKLILIESLIYPQLDYCNVVYYHYLSSEYKRKIQQAQNACIRFVFGVGKFDHVTPVYVRHNILKYEFRVMLHFGIFIFKIFKTKIPAYLWNFIVARRDLHDRLLRNLIRFHIPRHHTAKFRNCFSYLSVELLNTDTFHLIYNNSLATFRNKYKSSLIDRMLV